MEKLVDIVVFILSIILLHLTNNDRRSTPICTSIEYHFFKNITIDTQSQYNLIRVCDPKPSNDHRWTLSKAVFADQLFSHTEEKSSITEEAIHRLAKSFSTKKSSNDTIYRVDLTPPFHPPLSSDSFPWYTIKCLGRSFNSTTTSWQRIDSNAWIDAIMHMHCLHHLPNTWTVQAEKTTNQRAIQTKFLFQCTNQSNGLHCREIFSKDLSTEVDQANWTSAFLTGLNKKMVAFQTRIMTQLIEVDPTISHEGRVLIENPLLLCIVLFFFSMWPS